MKKTLIFAALVAALCSCSNEQVANPTSPQGDVKLGLSGSVGSITTKTNPSLTTATVGVYAWQTSATATTLATTDLKNTRYNVDGSGVFTANTAAIQLFSNKQYSACAYAPYKELSAAFTSTDAVPFVHAEDVLYAQALPVDITPAVLETATPAKANVKFSFVHKMAQVKFTLLKGEGEPDLTKADIKVTGFFGGCTMNLATGALSTTNYTKDGVIEQSQSTLLPLKEFTPVCIVPATLTLNITVTAGETVYYVSVPNKVFAANESHEFKLTLNKNTLSMSVEGTVVPWSSVILSEIAVPSI